MDLNLKKQLYLTLVRSKLTICSQLWRPLQIKHITLLENVQKRATKLITNDYVSNYRIRLLGLKLLLLMHWYELQDLLYPVKCLQNPPDNINLFHHISSVTSNTRRHQIMLQYQPTRTSFARHFYFNKIVKLWNAVQPIDISLPLSSIKHQLWNILWKNFEGNFNSANVCTYHFVCSCPQCHHIIY